MANPDPILEAQLKIIEAEAEALDPPKYGVIQFFKENPFFVGVGLVAGGCLALLLGRKH